ncbi:MAG: spore coat polysaccharide biosynthesis protein SpsF, partial [Planctomycetota bacterium]
MNAVAIIQARMSSTRLPGKVLMPIVGRPLLWHIVHRLQQCRELDKIVIATTTEDSDDPIEAFGKEHGVMVVRGSLDN